ncbi:hypothetical protein CMO91_03320 [Candidatus Woesearchaeota archaeon]|nr:hypothetical protein [Candidatus Woesearchaeota archaeon]
MERTYIIPLRKEWLKAPRYKRAKKAVTALKEFIQRHMKSETVKIGKKLNHALWERGIKNPPHKIKVNCKKEEEHCLVELHGHKFEEKKVEEPKKGLADKLGLTKKDEKSAKTEAPAAKEEKPADKPEAKKEPETPKAEPKSKPAPKEEKKSAPEAKPKKEKSEKEAIQDSFDSAKKLNELAKKSK